MLIPLFQGKEKRGQGDWDRNRLREVPVLPLRNVVAFPHGLLPLAVGLPRSIKLLEDVLDGDRLLVLLTMTDPAVEEPGTDGLYQIGTLAEVERALRVEDNYQIVVRGLARVHIRKWIAEEPYLKAQVDLAPEQAGDATVVEALRRHDEPVPPVITLHIDKSEMIRVDFRDNQGNIGLHPVRTRVAADRKPCIGTFSLNFFGHFCREGRKNEIHIFQAGNTGRAHPDIPDTFRERDIKAPFNDITIQFSCTPLGSRQCCQFEPGMLCQELNKPLPDCSCSTKHSDIDHR